VTTQDAKRQIALVVPNKSERVLNFHHQTLESVQEMLQAVGLTQPSDLSLKHIMRRVSEHEVQNLDTLMPSIAAGSLLNSEDLKGMFAQYWTGASPDHFQWKPEQSKA
jgi:hypothetical protein